MAVGSAATEALLCLAVVDFVSNAWHFGSQHAGVLRMYARKVGGGVPGPERWGVRLFVAYASLRAADLAVLAVPAAPVATNLAGATRDRVGKLAHLLGVCALYAGLVLGLRAQSTHWVVVFAAAGSMFHAVEYLAVVTHYARRRGAVGSPGRCRALARHWALFLGGYVLLLGSFGGWAAGPGRGVAASGPG